MTLAPEDRAKVDELKQRRAALLAPIERIAFDNDPANGPIGLRLVAMTEETNEFLASKDAPTG